MIIYRIITQYGDLEKDTKLTFNHSQQRFETLNHKNFISNCESRHHPGLIVVHQELTQHSERKQYLFTIKF